MYVCMYVRMYVRTSIHVYEVVCVLLPTFSLETRLSSWTDLRLLSNSVVTCLCCGNLITDVVRIRGSKLSSWRRKVRSTSAAHELRRRTGEELTGQAWNRHEFQEPADVFMFV